MLKKIFHVLSILLGIVGAGLAVWFIAQFSVFFFTGGKVNLQEMVGSQWSNSLFLLFFGNFFILTPLSFLFFIASIITSFLTKEKFDKLFFVNCAIEVLLLIPLGVMTWIWMGS